MYIDQVPGDPTALTFKDFGVTPKTIEDTILMFLRLFRPPKYQRAPYENKVKRYLEVA
jgi:hypothetical protein